MEDQNNLDDTVQLAFRQLYLILQDSKPKERSELARRYQVTTTELEKVMAYFDSFVVQRSYWPEP
jgi:hypothetical protein